MAATSPSSAYDLGIDGLYDLDPADTDPILQKYADKIEYFAYESRAID